jgi:hypothetical protein
MPRRKSFLAREEELEAAARVMLAAIEGVNYEAVGIRVERHGLKPVWLHVEVDPDPKDVRPGTVLFNHGLNN